MRWTFCPACAARLDADLPVRCPACSRAWWNNPVPSAGAIIEQQGEILWVQRNQEPRAGFWDLPGGFCDAGEHPVDTVRREVHEELGLRVSPGVLVGMWMDTYEDGSGVRDVLNLYFLVHPVLPTGPIEPDDDELRGAAWYPAGSPPTDLAFPNHIAEVMEAYLADGRLHR